MRILMRQTFEYIINSSKNGDEQALRRLEELRKEVSIIEKEKYFILKDE